MPGEPGQGPQPQPEQQLDPEVAGEPRELAQQRQPVVGRGPRPFEGRQAADAAGVPEASRRAARGAAAPGSRRARRSCRAPAGDLPVAAGRPTGGRAMVLSTSCLPSTKTRSTGRRQESSTVVLRSARCSTRSRTCGRARLSSKTCRVAGPPNFPPASNGSIATTVTSGRARARAERRAALVRADLDDRRRPAAASAPPRTAREPGRGSASRPPARSTRRRRRTRPRCSMPVETTHPPRRWRAGLGRVSSISSLPSVVLQPHAESDSIERVGA